MLRFGDEIYTKKKKERKKAQGAHYQPSSCRFMCRLTVSWEEFPTLETDMMQDRHVGDVGWRITFMCSQRMLKIQSGSLAFSSWA